MKADLSQATLIAKGNLLTHPFAVADEESVVFIEQLLIGGQVLHEQRLESGIVTSWWAQPQSGEYALGVGVNDEYRLVCGVEDYRVCRFWADAVDSE
jgi:hypothetical protein